MKFAYLIMAHDNEAQLIKLLKLLDYPENDIYLHLDVKRKSLFDQLALAKVVKRAKIYIYSRYKIYWADISQTKCQFFLLSQATKEYHDYYHLISGCDLPLKSQRHIIDFFEMHKGKEFVHFESDEYCSKLICRRFHFFNSLINKSENLNVVNFMRRLDKQSLCLQQKLKIERKFYCGANWFSITHRLATDLVKCKKKMLRKIMFTISSDEYVLQTYIKKNYKKYDLFYVKSDDNYISIMRKIDWERGNPYVWREKDYYELITSPYLFARKFDEKIDEKIIRLIYDYLRKDR